MASKREEEVAGEEGGQGPAGEVEGRVTRDIVIEDRHAVEWRVGDQRFVRRPENVEAAPSAWGDEAGRWRVEHGDCLDVMRAMPPESVDAVVADPPYGMAYVSARRKRDNAVTVPIAGDEAFDKAFHVAWAKEAIRVTKSRGAIYSFTSDHNLGAFREAFAAAGWNVKRTMVWMKNAWTSGDLEGDYGHQTEFVVYATKDRHVLRGERSSNILDFRRIPPGDLVHSCQKPAPLIAWLIHHSCEPGGLVLDPFLGSGTTLVAALGEGCRGLGIEREADYCKIAVARIASAASQGAFAFGSGTNG
jgi:DNA modification methylase